MSSKDFPEIPKEKLRFVSLEKDIHDTKFETRPIGYLGDALLRFKKNKGSVVAFIIILLLLIFALFGGFLSKNSMSETDLNYKNMLPKSEFFSQFGFWDAHRTVTVKQYWYDLYSGLPDTVTEVKEVKETKDLFRTSVDYTIEIDTYNAVGFVNYTVTQAQLDRMLQYEKDTGRQLLYPLINEDKVVYAGHTTDANLWYQHNSKGIAARDKDGSLVPNFIDDPSDPSGYLRVKDRGGNKYNVRVLYKEYYCYLNGHYPEFLLGSDVYGYDILSRLASGARFSFLLGFSVAIINIIIGVIYGSICGYYGGALDLAMTALTDILSAVPFMVVAILFNMHLAHKVGAIGSIIFAFILTGWIGVASRTRTQFYRYKGQEYVLAARTLGAKDRRIIFKHVLPNTLGTLITSTILMIPNVIFSESFLSYLGVIDLNSRTLTSVGALLSTGQSVMADYPHVILFPALFISLLMISFNIFGNGLRDAFNPSLRGADE